MQGLNGLLGELLALAVPAASQGSTIGTELTFFTCKPGRQVLVHFKGSSRHTSENCCQEMIELRAGVLVRV